MGPAKTGYLDRVEVLGFVDGKKSIDWIREAGGRVDQHFYARVLPQACGGSIEENPGRTFEGY